jgi:hypothetical protein
VDDISAGDQQAHQAIGGQHQALINLKQAQLAGLNIWGWGGGTGLGGGVLAQAALVAL